MQTFAGEVPRPEPKVTDTWSEPNPGVRYLRRKTSTPAVAHALIVDLTLPGVRIWITPYEQRWQTVGEFGSKNKLAAAINGGFWNVMQRPKGIAAGGGKRWPQGEDDDEAGFFALTSEQKAWISPPEIVQSQFSNKLVSDAVSGMPMLVRSGHVDSASLQAFEHSNLRHPRTSVGVSHDGKKVFLIVVDGRQGHSRGMTLYELARLFVELGAYNAINLDGGGSSAMYLGKFGRVINSPSGGRWAASLGLGVESESSSKRKTRVRDDGIEETFVRGVEREVMNHIGVIAPKPGQAVTTPRIEPAPDAGSPSISQPTLVAATPRKPTLQFGQSREVLVPLAWFFGLMLPGVAALILFRRRAKRVGRGGRGARRQDD